MNSKLSFFIGFFACAFMFVACATVFPYQRFGMQLPENCYEQGVLLGWEEDGSEDKPMSLCRPDDQAVGKCLIFQQQEFSRLKADYIDLEVRLKECEKQC